MRFGWIGVGLLCAVVGRADSQQAPIETQIAIGGANISGSGYDHSAELTGRLGVERLWASGWGARVDASEFARVNSSECLRLSFQCETPVPGTITTLMLHATRRFTILGRANYPLKLGLGAGVAHVGSSLVASSATSGVAGLTSELPIFGHGRFGVVVGAEALLITSADGHSLQAVPITLGLHF